VGLATAPPCPEGARLDELLTAAAHASGALAPA
jgi:hypothetical protein